MTLKLLSCAFLNSVCLRYCATFLLALHRLSLLSFHFYSVLLPLQLSDTTHLRVDIRDLERSIQIQQDALNELLLENGKRKGKILNIWRQNDLNEDHHVDIKSAEEKRKKAGHDDGFDMINVNLNGSTYQAMTKNTLLGMDTFLLIMCSNRPDYLKRTLDFVLLHHPR